MDHIRNGGNSDGDSPRRQSASDIAGNLLKFDVYDGEPFVTAVMSSDESAVYHDVLLMAATFQTSDGGKRMLLCQTIVGFRLPEPDGEEVFSLPLDERLKIGVGFLVQKDRDLNPDGLQLLSVLVRSRRIGRKLEDGKFEDESAPPMPKDEPPSADPRLN